MGVEEDQRLAWGERPLEKVEGKKQREKKRKPEKKEVQWWTLLRKPLKSFGVVGRDGKRGN